MLRTLILVLLSLLLVFPAAAQGNADPYIKEADRYFELPGDSPYMLLVQPVKESSRRPLPEDRKSVV